MSEAFDIETLEAAVAHLHREASGGGVYVPAATWPRLASMPANFRRATHRLSDVHVDIAKFCSIECEFQLTGPADVGLMVAAWALAQGLGEQHGRPTAEHIQGIAAVVDPVRNLAGFRRVGVRVGQDIKQDWQTVPDSIDRLLEYGDELSPDEFFYRFEDIHPFRDGNGRTGQILFNWLNGTLSTPTWASNWFDDPRRRQGRGIGPLGV